MVKRVIGLWVSTVFPRVPPSYRGSRLFVCVMLSLGVAAFFSTYGHITGTPSLSYQLDLPVSTIVPQSLEMLSEYDPFDEPPLPDMASPAVKLASADVLQLQDALVSSAAQPRKAQIKTVVAKQEQRRRSVKRQKAKPTPIAKVKVRSQSRVAYSHR